LALLLPIARRAKAIQGRCSRNPIATQPKAAPKRPYMMDGEATSSPKVQSKRVVILSTETA
jgi:hypothetical protein